MLQGDDAALAARVQLNAHDGVVSAATPGEGQATPRLAVEQVMAAALAVWRAGGELPPEIVATRRQVDLGVFRVPALQRVAVAQRGPGALRRRVDGHLHAYDGLECHAILLALCPFCHWSVDVVSQASVAA